MPKLFYEKNVKSCSSQIEFRFFKIRALCSKVIFCVFFPNSQIENKKKDILFMSIFGKWNGELKITNKKNFSIGLINK